MKTISKSLQDTEAVAKDFVKYLPKQLSDKAFIVGLYGDLGSGKTTFTQDVAKLFGITEDITSPTYVIEKIYDIKHAVFKKLIHIDAYRLDSGKELLALDWDTIANDPHTIILIEWPERVADILPKDHKKIHFKFISENEREIEM